MRGVLYCAVKNPIYADYLRASIKSLRRVGYAGPISVVSDLGQIVDENVISSPSYRSPKEAKIKSFALSPYDTTLYLDCDVYALLPIDEIWGNLVSSNLCMVRGLVPAIRRVHHAKAEELTYTLSVCHPDFPHYNSGVALWMKAASNDTLWVRWAEEWDRFKDIDELALARALKTEGCSVFDLPSKFNFVVDTSRRRPDGLGVLWHDGFTLKSAPTIYPELFS